MTTFANGESGLSVRTKINNVLQHTDGTAGELVINEAGADVDFRVESDTNANALFMDGATGNVGIGTSSPAAKLHSSSADGGAYSFGLNGTTKGLRVVHNSTGTAIQGVDATLSATYEPLSIGGSYTTITTSSLERLRIDASGNVGIGTSSPTAKLHIVQTDPAIRLTRTTDFFYGQLSADGFSAYTNTNDNAPIIFKTATNERLRIDASGNLLVGTTAYPTSVGTSGVGIRNVSGIIGQIAIGKTSSGTSDAQTFYHNGTYVGGVQISETTTTFLTSSDYRLKEDLQPIADASLRLAALNPVNFAWKADGTRTDGFIAHEVQAVAPQAVTGEKDGEAMQAIDHSKLVPLLTAALQEALAKIATLETRISALEA